MKYLTIAALILAGCSQAPRTELEASGLKEATVIVIEGCEYISYKSSHGYWHVEHKGNCSNPIHHPCDTLR